MTLGLNHNEIQQPVEIVPEPNSFGVIDAGSLQPALNAYRVRALSETMDKAKAEIRNLLNTENDAEFARKLKIAIQKYYDPKTQTLVLPPEILEMLQNTAQNPDLESMISILEEIGFDPSKSTYTKEERDNLSENTTQVLNRLNQKLQNSVQKTQEINQMTMEIMQMLRAALKKEDDAKSSSSRKIGNAR